MSHSIVVSRSIVQYYMVYLVSHSVLVKVVKKAQNGTPQM